MQIRVATNPCTADENIGHSALTSLGLKGGLDLSTVRDLIELDKFELHVLSGEQLLGSVAVRAEGLAVYDNFVAGHISIDHIANTLSHYFIWWWKI